MSRAKAEADARLIAAAPELLEALKRLLAFDAVRYANDRGPVGEGWQSDALVVAMLSAEAAMAKATKVDAVGQTSNDPI